MARTKADLEKEIKALKQQIRDLKSEVKVGEELSGELDDLAIGVFVKDDNRFEILKISFDKSKKSAIIGEVVKETNSATEAVRFAQIAIGKHVTDLNKGR